MIWPDNNTYETTGNHPQLKSGIEVKRATNPEGMYLADAYFIMTKHGDIYYETAHLNTHIEKGLFIMI